MALNCAPFGFETTVRSAPILLAVGLVMLQGCQSPQTYDWGQYEASLYKLAKNPEALDEYGAMLLAQIQRGEAARRVPPGVFAEYGYVLLVNKQGPEALRYFAKEKERWPESALLMDRMMKLASSPAPQAP